MQRGEVGMMVVGLDVGYGWTKVVRGGRSWVFPSLVGSASAEHLAALFGGDVGDGVDDLRVEVEGLGRFAVGKLALNESADATRAFEQDRREHVATRVLVDAAAALVLASGQPAGGLHLATGLPLAYWASQRGSFLDWLAQLDDRVCLLSGPHAGVRLRVAPTQVTVYPQAAGALYYAMFDVDGRVRDRELLTRGGLVGVIDVGYRTTDYLVLDLDEGLRVREDLAGTEELGTVQVGQVLQRAFQAKTGTGAVLPPDRLERARQRGSVEYRGRSINLSQDLAVAAEGLARAVGDRVKAAWGPQADFLSRIYLAGGGALVLGDGLLECFPGSQVVPDAQFANAYGFAAVAAAASAAGVRAG